MIDHISINVSSFEKSKAFYVAVLGPLGIGPLMEFPGVVGFGVKGSGKAQFWLGAHEPVSQAGHIAFAAPSREAVRRFHEAGLKSGGRDEGGPGLRPQYHPSYFAAFLWDPDGFKVEAVIHTEE